MLDRLPKNRHHQAKLLLRQMVYAETRQECERLKNKFAEWCGKHGHNDAAQTLDRDWERMVTFYEFPREHWPHIRTTNLIGSPFAALRLRTDAAKRFKKVENATAVIWKMLQIAEKRFRRLKHHELLAKVSLGVEYLNGMERKPQQEATAA